MEIELLCNKENASFYPENEDEKHEGKLDFFQQLIQFFPERVAAGYI